MQNTDIQIEVEVPDSFDVKMLGFKGIETSGVDESVWTKTLAENCNSFHFYFYITVMLREIFRVSYCIREK